LLFSSSCVSAIRTTPEHTFTFHVVLHVLDNLEQIKGARF